MKTISSFVGLLFLCFSTAFVASPSANELCLEAKERHSNNLVVDAELSVLHAESRAMTSGASLPSWCKKLSLAIKKDALAYDLGRFEEAYRVRLYNSAYISGTSAQDTAKAIGVKLSPLFFAKMQIVERENALIRQRIYQLMEHVGK